MSDYEFFGPVGTALCTFCLPVLVYVMDFLANERGCLSFWSFELPGWNNDVVWFSWRAVGVVYGWLGLHVTMHVLLPARQAHGVVEPHGAQWKYRLNSLQNTAAVYASIGLLAFLTPWLPLHWAADHYLELLTGSLILSCSLSICFYLLSFRAGACLSASSGSSSIPYTFWMGRELNPRHFNIDWKEFFELYPGMAAWAVLNLAFAHKQFVETGSVRSPYDVSLPLILVNLFQLFYVGDALAHEQAVLTTMDITSEGLGFMLVFGDLTWVPFIYCQQAKYLAQHAVAIPWYWAQAVFALNMVGYAVFRGSNSQKDQFRRDPDHPSVAHLESLSTGRGTKLICSGWWGMARHINYTGDWLMGFAWCLTCGFGCILPYFYAIYFAVLLVHRDRRDDEACYKKYGEDWLEYCKRVPYKLIPYIY